MVIESCTQLASILGISTTFLVVIILISIWDTIWKLIALWKPQKLEIFGVPKT